MMFGTKDSDLRPCPNLLQFDPYFASPPCGCVKPALCCVVRARTIMSMAFISITQPRNPGSDVITGYGSLSVKHAI